MRGDPVSKTKQTQRDCEYDFLDDGEPLRVTEHGGALICKEHCASSVFGSSALLRLTVLKSLTSQFSLRQETLFSAAGEG